MPFTITPAAPIKSAGGDVTTITFRDPIGEDVFELEKPPFRTIMQGGQDDVEFIMDGKMLRRWMRRLAPDVGGDVIGAMTARDVRKVYDWLVPLLNPEGEPNEDAEKN